MDKVTESNKRVFNNWAFTETCVERIMAFDFKNAPDHGVVNTEVAKACRLLKLYKEAYKITSNQEVFSSLKAKDNFDDGIDFWYFIQYLVLVERLMLTDDASSITKQLHRQYHRDRFYFETEHTLQSKIDSEYLERETLYDLENHAVDIARSGTKEWARKGGKARWKPYKEQENWCLETFKENYAYEGEDFFEGCTTYYDKIKKIQDRCSIEHGQKIGFNKAARWYSKECEKKRRKSKP